MKFAAVSALCLALQGVVVSTSASAEEINFNCEFQVTCEPKKGCNSNGLSFQIQIDTLTQDAFIVGNGGLAPLKAYEGDRGITFLELLPAGAIQTTTIEFGGDAVHSRHTIMGSELVPSQLYGRCSSKPANG